MSAIPDMAAAFAAAEAAKVKMDAESNGERIWENTKTAAKLGMYVGVFCGAVTIISVATAAVGRLVGAKG